MRILSWFFLGAVLEGFTRLYEFASRSQGTVVPCRGRMSPNRSALSSSDVGSITVSEDHGFFSFLNPYHHVACVGGSAGHSGRYDSAGNSSGIEYTKQIDPGYRVLDVTRSQSRMICAFMWTKIDQQSGLKIPATLLVQIKV
ncbi:Uncharacterized protein HZ326_2247 [Fusarium oxysporum f. sp. albedinis]|nr:Uncharacterized protein HZ326_2247 [Fusarium oxysporum f. sp. albedinis]